MESHNKIKIFKNKMKEIGNVVQYIIEQRKKAHEELSKRTKNEVDAYIDNLNNKHLKAN